MGRTLLTGATGRLGEALRLRLAESGRAVRATSRSPPTDADARERTADHDGDVDWVELDLADGTGVEAAVRDVDVVVHAASAPSGDSEAVDVEGTKRLLEAASDAGVSNFVYVSIAGIDEIPFTYYQHKLAAEEAVESSDVPGTILRATQFHSFVDDVVGMVAWLPVWPLPTKFQVQPIDVREVADAVVDHATPEASGRVAPMGGPAVRTLGDLASDYRAARGLRWPIVRLPIPGGVARAFRAGEATCPDRAVGTVTWEDWLAEQYGGESTSATSHTGSPT